MQEKYGLSEVKSSPLIWVGIDLASVMAKGDVPHFNLVVVSSPRLPLYQLAAVSFRLAASAISIHQL